jgi:AcrR family transcriptional regulator
MRDGARNLTPKQLKAIAALLATSTREEAASAAGVSPATLYRWLKDDGFREEYRDERYRVVGHVVGELLAKASAAVTALGEGLEDSDINARLRAARFVLDYVLKGTELDRRLHEQEELEARLDAIEEALQARSEERGFYRG